MSHRALASFSCFTAAAVWPTLVSTLTTASMSPLERAMRESICGLPLHDATALLGHCAPCWAGSAMLIAAGLSILLTNARREPVRASVRD